MLYLALEKRYNFSLDDLDVVANGYLHFRSYLQLAGGKHTLVASRCVSYKLVISVHNLCFQWIIQIVKALNVIQCLALWASA